MADTLVSKFQTIATSTSTYDIFDEGNFVTTILSWTICNTDTDDCVFEVYIDPSGTATEDAGGTNSYIYSSQSLPSGSTFEHTDKIILHANDGLKLGMLSGNSSISISSTSLKQT